MLAPHAETDVGVPAGQWENPKVTGVYFIQKMQLDKVRKDLNEEYRIVEHATFERLHQALVGHVAAGGKGVVKGSPVTAAQLAELPQKEWFKIRMEEDALNDQIDRAEESLAE